MSEDNIERLRTLLEAWAAGTDIDTSVLHPDVVFEDDVLPDHAGETYRGREGLARATETWLEVYDRVSLKLERILGSGDRLVSVHRFQGQGRSSGIEEEIRYAYLWTFENGRVIHFMSFRHPDEALEAAGLSE